MSDPHRILLVTGKGGVGKSTVSMALSLAAVAEGQRVVLAETAGADRVPAVFGLESQGYALLELQDRLWTLSITPEAAIEDYVVQQIKFRRLYQLVFRNRVMGPFVDAVPGLHDAVQLGKVFDLDRERRGLRPAFDRIVVDAPATGHGLTMLASPRSMMDLTRAGPLYEGVKRVHDVMTDPKRAGLVLVTLAEEMPVNETLELWEKLGDAREQVVGCVLNEVLPRPFAHPEDWPIAREAILADDPRHASSVAITDHLQARIERQEDARARLQEALPVPVIDLPLLPHRDLRPADIASLSTHVAPLLRTGASA